MVKFSNITFPATLLRTEAFECTGYADLPYRTLFYVFIVATQMFARHQVDAVPMQTVRRTTIPFYEDFGQAFGDRCFIRLAHRSPGHKSLGARTRCTEGGRRGAQPYDSIWLPDSCVFGDNSLESCILSSLHAASTEHMVHHRGAEVIRRPTINLASSAAIPCTQTV